jgi:hypothetical protein
VYSAAAAFPVSVAGRLPRCAFRGLLGVHSRYGLLARGIAYAILFIEDFDGFVTSTAAPITSGWSDKLPGGALTRWKTNAFMAYTLIALINTNLGWANRRFPLRALFFKILMLWLLIFTRRTLVFRTYHKRRSIELAHDSARELREQYDLDGLGPNY